MNVELTTPRLGQSWRENMEIFKFLLFRWKL